MKISSFSLFVCFALAQVLQFVTISSQESGEVHSRSKIREPPKHGAASSVYIAVLISNMPTKPLSAADT
jgi:uncharacterized protein with FMN-binding domain